MRHEFCKVPYIVVSYIRYTGALTYLEFQSLSDSSEFAGTILMLKLFENRFINTMNKLAVSIEDIKRGRSSPPFSQHAGNPSALDFMLDRTTLLDHQRLMKELSDMLGREREKEQKRECDRQEERARDEHRERERDVLLKNMRDDIVLLKRKTHDLAQGCYSRERTAGAVENAHKAGLQEEDTIGSDKLEQVCLHRTRSDEPMVEDLHQTMRDLKERLGELSVRAAQQFPAIERARAREQRPFRRHTPADDIASPLFVPYSPQDKGQRGKESRGGTARERLHSHGNELKTERSEALKTLYLKYIYKRPFSAATDGKCQGTPTVLNLQAELVQVSQFPTFKTDGSGGGRDARLSRYQPGASIEIDLPE
jgi:hypothetical protein